MNITLVSHYYLARERQSHQATGRLISHPGIRVDINLYSLLNAEYLAGFGRLNDSYSKTRLCKRMVY